MVLSRIRRIFAAMVFLLVPLLAFGQSNRGRIIGTVTDSSGGAIPGAKVTIENLGTHVQRVLETNRDGDYFASDLEPGFYSVSAMADKFKTVTRERVQIEVGNDLKLDFNLQPGAISEVVQVSDVAPITETSNAVLSGVLSNTAINELPVQGRDFQNLLNLHPGVQRSAGGGYHSTTSNGLRPDDNNFIIDGANNNDVYWGETVVNDAGITGTPASTLPLDAIQEFNTQEQPQADFGVKPGVVVNIGIKSGTDQIHGSAYYFNRNAVFDARNYFNPTTEPVSAVSLNQFGASIGGPIIKGKWFYFANYEGVRSTVGVPQINYAPVTSSLATPDQPEGDPANSIVDAMHALGCDTTPTNCNQLSLNLLKYFPTNPGYTASTSDPTAINFNFNNLNRADNLVFKTDYHFNDHHTISGRYIYANSTQTEEDGSPLASQWLSHAAPITQVIGVNWIWTPNSRWTNNAQFGYNSFYEKIAPVDSNVSPADYGLNTGVTDPRLYGFPTIYPSYDCCNALGGVSGWPAYTAPSHTANYSDTASVIFGKHTLRFGGVFANGGVDYYRARYGRGLVYFDNLTEYLEGIPSDSGAWNFLYGNPGRNISMKSWGLFAQDDYRITRRVTLNLGLRYDVVYPIKDSHNQLANYVPSQGIVQVGDGISEPYQTNYNNLSPRLGVAWDVTGTGKTVVRAGFGMIYVQPSIRTFMFSSGGLNLNPSGLPGVTPGTGNMDSFLVTNGDASQINWSVAGPIFPTLSSIGGGCTASFACDIFAVNQKLKSPYVINWNLNVQQQITPSTMLQVAYVANRGVKLYSTVDINQVDPAIDDGTEQLGRPLTASCPPPVGLGEGSSPCYPYIRFLNYLGNQSTSSYNSLQVTLTKRASHGLYLLAGYTFGHAIDTAGNTNNLGYVPQNSLDYPAEKGSGDFDIRHRFTLSAVYDLPSKKSWAQMLEGWQVTTIVMVETGPPVDLYDDIDDLSGTGEGRGNASNERWNIKGDGSGLKWSRTDPIPFLSNTYDDDGNVIARNPICTSVANTAALLESLDYIGGCYSQNGTILYPQAFYTFGNMGRNIFRGPGFVNWDASVSKYWRLGEKFQLQFRAEFFNLLNHPNFSPTSIGAELGRPSSLGVVNYTPDVEASNPVVGSGGSRHLQFGLKLTW
jgi:Carboxypeptidase regulatory-like domain/TonB dependent receptor